MGVLFDVVAVAADATLVAVGTTLKEPFGVPIALAIAIAIGDSVMMVVIETMMMRRVMGY
jgi:hypothetical protein